MCSSGSLGSLHILGFSLPENSPGKGAQKSRSLSVHGSTSLPTFLSVRPFYIPIYLSPVCTSIHPSVHPSTQPSTNPPILTPKAR